jgi:hypothetical protein
MDQDFRWYQAKLYLAGLGRRVQKHERGCTWHTRVPPTRNVKAGSTAWIGVFKEGVRVLMIPLSTTGGSSGRDQRSKLGHLLAVVPEELKQDWYWFFCRRKSHVLHIAR